MDSTYVPSYDLFINLTDVLITISDYGKDKGKN